MIQKSKREKEKSIYKNQTQLVTATQPSSLHSAALPRSSVKLPPLLCSSHRTAQTSLQISCFQSVPRREPGSRRFVQPGTACCSHEPGASCATSAVPPAHPLDHTLASRLLLPSQGPLPCPPQEGSGQRLLPFLHTLLVTRGQEVAMGNLQTDSLI